MRTPRKPPYCTPPGSLTTAKLAPWAAAAAAGTPAGVPLLGVGQLNRLTGGLLQRGRGPRRANLRRIVLVGRGAHEREQVPQGVDGGVRLRARGSLASLVYDVPVVAGPRRATCSTSRRSGRPSTAVSGAYFV